MNVVFVTGSANKAKYFSELVGLDVPHLKVDAPEIQSLDLLEVVSEKARAAYAIVGTPVLVEDTSLVIHSFGKLPGTFIKWFLEEIGFEKLLLQVGLNEDRSATASAAFAYFDGEELKVFKGEEVGTIAPTSKGSTGFGWNSLFIPEGASLTLGEMDDATFKSHYLKIKPIEAVKEFLDNLQA